jgi:hypothetical protein
VRIHTDDPDNPSIQAIITGRVEKFAEIQPERINLIGAQGQPISAEIVISPRKEYPFRIEGISVRDGSFIKYELKEQCADGNGRCVILVENTRADKGRYGDILSIRTDSPLRPELSIRVNGRIH